MIDAQMTVNNNISDNDESVKAKKLTILIPAIVCEGCVNTLKLALQPYLLNNDLRNLKIDSETKKAVVTMHSSSTVEILLKVIDDAGYGEPKPIQLFSDSIKRNRRFEEEDKIEDVSYLIHKNGSVN